MRFCEALPSIILQIVISFEVPAPKTTFDTFTRVGNLLKLVKLLRLFCYLEKYDEPKQKRALCVSQTNPTNAIRYESSG